MLELVRDLLGLLHIGNVRNHVRCRTLGRTCLVQDQDVLTVAHVKLTSRPLHLVRQDAFSDGLFDMRFVLFQDINQVEEVFGDIYIFVDHVCYLLLDEQVELGRMLVLVVASEHQS